MLKKPFVILFLIVIIASFLRLYQLGVVPPSVISDEASIVYNAYSILKTGRDEWGNFLPLSFPAFGDNKLPGLIYATVPSVFVFGLNEFSTRLPSAIFGILTVIAVYFLSLEIFRDRKTALLTSLFTAISPWSLHISRMAIEANMAIFFTVLGVLLFFKSFKKQKLLFLSFLSFSATFYIYNSNRVFIPLLVLSLLVIYRKELGNFKKNLLLPILVFALVTLPVSKHFIEQSITGRFSKVAVTADYGMTYNINDEREFCTRSLPKAVCYAASNKAVKYVDAIIKNYISHYSARFLFLTGPENLKHYSLPDFGEYYIFQLPLFLFGILYLMQKKQKESYFLISWLIFFPVASSLTSIAHPIRSAVGVPVFEIIMAYGLITFLKNIKSPKLKYIFLILVLALAFLNINEYLFRYYVKYSKDYSEVFQYGYKEAFQFTKEEEKNNSKIIVTKKYGEPQIFYLFYNKIDPKWYQESPEVTKTERSDKWKDVKKIGMYYFRDLSAEKPTKESGTLFVLNPNELNGSITTTKTIMYLNGKPVFHLAK